MKVSDDFVASIRANLIYWDQQIKFDHWDDENALRACKFGLGLEETYSYAIGVGERGMRLAEKAGNYGEWNIQFNMFLEENINLEGQYAARVYLLIGNYSWRMGKVEEAAEDYQNALKISTNAESKELQISANLGLSRSLWGKKKYSQALAAAEQAEELIETLPACAKNEMLGELDQMKGMIYFTINQYDVAQDHFLKAMDNYSETDQSLAYTRLMNNLGLTMMYLGDSRKALVLMGKAATNFERLGYPQDLIRVEISRAMLHFLMGNKENALRAIQRNWKDEIITPRDKAWRIFQEGFSALFNGQYEDAIYVLGNAKVLWLDLGDEIVVQMIEMGIQLANQRTVN